MTKQNSVFEIPASVSSVAEQIVAARRGWSGPIGMTMTQGQPEGGADGGGTDQGAGLLDDEAENGGADGGGSGDGSGDGGGAGGTGGPEGETPAAMEARLRREFESEIDRRVNSAVQTVTRRFQQQQGQQGGGQQGAGGGDNGGGGNDGGQGGGGGNAGSGLPAGPNASDSREARMVYREYVVDEIKFLGNEERDFAAGVATGLLRERLEAGDDPETAGRHAAKEVAKQMKSLRGHYETKVLSALRRQGVIPADGRGSGQPLPGSGAPGDVSGFKKGSDRAAAMYADRLPRQQS